MDLENKKVLITGANRGMGKAFRNEFLKRGANVTMINRSKAEEASQAREVLADLSKTEDFEQLIKDNSLSDTDIIVNNAGTLVGGLLEDQDPQKISQMIKVNLEVPIRLSRAFIPSMVKRGSGLIVNNASVSGVMTFPCASTYAATKSGLVSFSNALREELLKTGVRVCVLMTPGVKTEMYDQISDSFSPHLDLSFLTSMPAEDWANIVIDGIEKEEDEIRPRGSENIGLHLAQKMPHTFKKMFRSKFSRKAD